MRALVCKAFGPPEDLVLEEVDAPLPGPGQVRVDVHAAGINFPDILVFAGKYQVRTEPPFIPGYEASGVVNAVGDGVTRLTTGDKVILTPMGGAFAEQIVVDEAHAFPMPPMLSFEQAAGFPITYCTSYHALKQSAALQPGESLLVLGAAGGVGTTAVEIGKAFGARVIAAASSDEKLDFARSVGADEAINYATTPLKDAVRSMTDGNGVDVVYDPVGGELAEAALRATGWHGRYLVIGFASGDIPSFPANLALLKEASIIGVFWGQWAATEPKAHLDNIGEMIGMLAEGKLKPRITATYALDDYVQAYDDVANRRVTGKTVFGIR
jgi:NADPH2:quinone reductase